MTDKPKAERPAATDAECPICGSRERAKRRRSHCAMTCPPQWWRWVTDERASPTDEIECDYLWHDYEERPTEQPGTPLNAICLNCKMPFSDHQASKEPHCPKGHWEWADTVFAAEVYRVAEALASQWKECPKCHQPVSGPHECYNSVLNGEAPAQTAGTGTEEKSAVAAWQREANFDRDVTSFEDIFVLGWKARARLSSAAFSPEPAATMQELVKFIAENADFGPLMPNDIEGIAQLMQKWAAIRAKASAEKEQK